MTRICRRELLRFVAYGLPAWLGYSHLRERNEPPPVRMAVDFVAAGGGGARLTITKPERIGT